MRRQIGKLIVVSYLLLIIMGNQMFSVKATEVDQQYEHTGVYLNRVYGTQIAATNRSALESDLFALENKLSDVAVIEQSNVVTEGQYNATLQLLAGRIDTLTALSVDFERVLEGYHLSLSSTDLNWILKSRAELQTFMREHEIGYQVGVNASQMVFEPTLLNYDGDSLEALTLEVGMLRTQIKALNANTDYGRIPASWPTDGTVTSGFGVRKDPFTQESAFHSGVDLAAPTGTQVMAWFNGTVVSAGESGGWGKQVLIQQGDLMVRYAHLNSIHVSIGQEVKQGNLIGTVGSTGRSTGPHLHLSLYLGGIAVDPSKIFN